MILLVFSNRSCPPLNGEKVFGEENFCGGEFCGGVFLGDEVEGLLGSMGRKVGCFWWGLVVGVSW